MDKNLCISIVVIWKTWRTVASPLPQRLWSLLGGVICPNTALVQVANTPRLGHCNSLWTVSALPSTAPQTHYSLLKTRQWHPNTREIKSGLLPMTYMILHVLASTFSKLLSNSPLNHCTPDTLGILAMFWTWQDSYTCHSLYVPPELTWPISHFILSSAQMAPLQRGLPRRLCKSAVPFMEKGNKIKKQGTGYHKTEKWVSGVKMSNIRSEQD